MSPLSGPASSSAFPRPLDAPLPSILWHTWGCAGTRLRTRAALHGCGVTAGGGISGVSAATAAAAGGQDRGPAAHHARPGPAGNDSEVEGAPEKVEADSAGGLRARTRRPPSVCRLRPRFCSLPVAGPVPAAAQPYCTARAGPGLPAGAYQVRRGESRPRSAGALSGRARAPPPSWGAGPRAWGRL